MKIIVMYGASGYILYKSKFQNHKVIVKQLA